SSRTYSIAVADGETDAPDPAGAATAVIVDVSHPRGPAPLPLTRGTMTTKPVPPVVSVTTPMISPSHPVTDCVTFSPRINVPTVAFVPIGIFIVLGPCRFIQAPKPKAPCKCGGYKSVVGSRSV